MKLEVCYMQPADAPPGFWPWPHERPVLVNGVALDSDQPTRFFQTVDACPREWGRFSWRIQLNRVVGGHAQSPVFRTFYQGVEWNLALPEHRWFLSAWFKWDGLGPDYEDERASGRVQIAGDTALFRISWFPKLEREGVTLPEPDLKKPLFLRSRIDARARRQIYEAVRAERDASAKTESTVIVLDDIINKPKPP